MYQTQYFCQAALKPAKYIYEQGMIEIICANVFIVKHKHKLQR